MSSIRMITENLRQTPCPDKLIGYRNCMSDLIHAELSEKIIGAAIKVHTVLNPGLDEKLYERALIIELRKRGHVVEQQIAHAVYYESELIGTLQPDLIVNEKIIVDPKVVTAFNDTHLAQMSGYLAITGLHLAILLNFKFARLQIKRVIRTGPVDSID